MPPLLRPDHAAMLVLPPRQGTLAATCDVLVVGGGPAGLGAAIGAAQAEARTVLVERYGFLGGNATASLVMPLMSFHTQHTHREIKGDTSLVPTDHGPGDPVLAGVLAVFLKRLVEAGGAIAPTLQTGYVVPFDPEIFKLTALEMLDEAGVEYLFHAFASGVIKDADAVTSVIFETKSGPVVIRAKVTIDATGDGDIAFGAGAPYELGRAEDGLVQPMTLMFRMGDFEKERFDHFIKEHPDQWRGVHGLWKLIQEAIQSGELKLERDDLLFFATPHPDEVSVNSTRVKKVSGIDVWDLSYAEWESRRQMKQIVRFLRRHVPGFEKAYNLQSGSTIGVRETRRIMGEYRLTADDVLSARKFPDVIARCTYPLDIHDPKGTGTLLQRLPPGESYDIPLRCLIPKGVEGLLVAGRCISGTHETHSSYRVMPVAMATGQAAGACAALASRRELQPRQVPWQEVQNELLRQGADLRDIRSQRMPDSSASKGAPL